jgi:hypothetical protein
MNEHACVLSVYDMVRIECTHFGIRNSKSISVTCWIRVLGNICFDRRPKESCANFLKPDGRRTLLERWRQNLIFFQFCPVVDPYSRDHALVVRYGALLRSYLILLGLTTCISVWLLYQKTLAHLRHVCKEQMKRNVSDDVSCKRIRYQRKKSTLNLITWIVSAEKIRVTSCLLLALETSFCPQISVCQMWRKGARHIGSKIPHHGRGGDLDSDEAKTRSKRTKEQVQTKNRNKYKPRTETRTTPSNQTRRQASGFHISRNN